MSSHNSLKNIQSKTESLAEILKQGRLQVPKFQRDYSWKLEQWEELWSDVIDSTENPGSPEEHYMGYIVLRESDEASDCFDIIDGQQRLTTLSILLLAAISSISEAKRVEILIERYIGEKDPMTYKVDSKLVLNENNKDLYEKLSNGENPTIRAKEKISNKLLLRAFEYFQNKINNLHEGDESATVRFALDVAEGIHLTRIKLLRNMNLYKIFQTLNATGKQLSINDLLKNYLFLAIERRGGLNKGQAAELHGQWKEIEETVEDKNLTRFISVEWNRRNEFCRTKDLFREINLRMQQPKDIYGYLKILRNSGELYAQLLKVPVNEHWDSRYGNASSELTECLECLNQLKIRSPHGLLLSALEKIQKVDTLKKILRVIRIISMRYNGICQKQANRQEKIYSEMAHDAYHGSFVFDEKTKRKLQELYPSDTEFYSEFIEVQFDKSNTNKAKYILSVIESKIYSPTNKIHKVDLEHVLPRNPAPPWKEIFPEHENYISRLGNMMLVPKKLNKEASNKPFQEKKKIYLRNKAGTAKLTEHVCTKYDVWDANAINEFQKFLAEQALKIWSIDWNKL